MNFCPNCGHDLQTFEPKTLYQMLDLGEEILDKCKDWESGGFKIVDIQTNLDIGCPAEGDYSETLEINFQLKPNVNRVAYDDRVRKVLDDARDQIQKACRELGYSEWVYTRSK